MTARASASGSASASGRASSSSSSSHSRGEGGGVPKNRRVNLNLSLEEEEEEEEMTLKEYKGRGKLHKEEEEMEEDEVEPQINLYPNHHLQQDEESMGISKVNENEDDDRDMEVDMDLNSDSSHTASELEFLENSQQIREGMEKAAKAAEAASAEAVPSAVLPVPVPILATSTTRDTPTAAATIAGAKRKGKEEEEEEKEKEDEDEVVKKVVSMKNEEIDVDPLLLAKEDVSGKPSRGKGKRRYLESEAGKEEEEVRKGGVHDDSAMELDSFDALSSKQGGGSSRVKERNKKYRDEEMEGHASTREEELYLESSEEDVPPPPKRKRSATTTTRKSRKQTYEEDSDDEEVYVKPVSKAAAKKAAGFQPWKKGQGLDLDAFYEQPASDTQQQVQLQFPARDLPLPPHLNKPTFFPLSFSVHVGEIGELDPPRPLFGSSSSSSSRKKADTKKDIKGKSSSSSSSPDPEIEDKDGSQSLWWHFTTNEMNNPNYPYHVGLDGKEFVFALGEITFQLPMPATGVSVGGYTAYTVNGIQYGVDGLPIVLAGGLPATGCWKLEQKRRKQNVVMSTRTIVYNFQKETREQAIERFIETDSYFKATFPFPTGENCELFPGKNYKKLVSSKGVLLDPFGLMVFGSSRYVLLPEDATEAERAAEITKYGMGGGRFIAREKPGKAVSKIKNPHSHAHQQKHGIAPIRNLDIYFNTSYFGTESFKIFGPNIRDGFLSQILRHGINSFRFNPFYPKEKLSLGEEEEVVPVEEICDPSSIITWMKKIETKATAEHPDDSIHELTLGETHANLRFGEEVLNLNALIPSLDDKVSGSFLEKVGTIYGGTLVYNSVADKQSYSQGREVLLKLVDENRSSIQDLSMTPFQKHFLLPTSATLIVSTNGKLWKEHAEATGKFPKIVVIGTKNDLVNLTWDDVLFADLIIYDNSSNNLPYDSVLRWSSPPVKFVADRVNYKGECITSFSDDPNLGKMQSFILKLKESLFKKGQVDLGGIYYSRVIYDVATNHYGAIANFAGDWKWALGDQASDFFLNSNYMYTGVGIVAAHLKLKDVAALSFLHRFVRSVTPSTRPYTHNRFFTGKLAQKSKVRKTATRKPIALAAEKNTHLDAAPADSDSGSEASVGPLEGGEVAARQYVKPTFLSNHMANAQMHLLRQMAGIEDSREPEIEVERVEAAPRPVLILAGAAAGPAIPAPPVGIPDVEEDGGNDEDYSDQLAQLLGMGFDLEKASEALQKYDGDVNRSVNFLVEMM